MTPIKLNLSDDLVEILQDIRRIKTVSRTQLIRDSINLYVKYFNEHERAIYERMNKNREDYYCLDIIT